MTKMKRTTKTEYYLALARDVALRSPCSRRRFGAIIVKNDAILSTGYNGSCRGAMNCGEDIECLKDLNNEESYKSYSYCPAVHAEQNAVINAARSGVSVLDSTMYLAPFVKKDGDTACHLCMRTLINAGVKDFYYLNKDGKIVYSKIADWIKLENEWMENQKRERARK